MRFCIECSTILQYQGGTLKCPLCAYVYPIDKQIVTIEHILRKVLDPIFSEDDMKTMPQTSNVRCPACLHSDAYFHEMKILNELSIILYICSNVRCRKHWKS
ncbi:hypothetical protein ZOSMA_66G00510 [Zostera marina]|uniref:TFIIS-type domain-containing protein n=1 Tax=Zostera marina TaxID=29655 RepID=A0A0K9NS99_ZOSMR|nr:hypothetical protein ZOSMA_66G00510 [Zostera marina]